MKRKSLRVWLFVLPALCVLAACADADPGPDADAGPNADRVPEIAVFDEGTPILCEKFVSCKILPADKQQACVDEARKNQEEDRAKAEGKFSPCSRVELDKCLEDIRSAVCPADVSSFENPDSCTKC